MSKVRLRFAPSPTGNLHLGTLRAALFNWLYAKKMNGSFICRIEDTDALRSKSEFEESIFQGLDWLGLNCDESPKNTGKYGPYRQSERKLFYQKYLDILIDKGLAYYCFCSPEDLEKERLLAQEQKKPYVYSGKYRNYCIQEAKKRIAQGDSAVLRFKMPRSGELLVSDLIRGEVTFDYSLIGDFILQKSDGTASFNFAVVVDDALMKITHVIRGEDHLSNMPRQLALYDALGFKPPLFAHLPMILGSDKRKLSKRHGATNVIDYKQQGFLPEAMLNYLALLGWSSANGQEKLSVDQLVAAFEITDINKSGAIFDIKKLSWLNGQYLRDMPFDVFKLRIKDFVSNTNQQILNERYSQDKQNQIFELAQASIGFLSDMNSFLSVFTDDHDSLLQRRNALDFNADNFAFLSLFQEHLENFNEGSDDMAYKQCLLDIVDLTGLSKGKVFRPVRMALTGFDSGPDLFKVLSILGQKCLIDRLNQLI